jgi:ankyrin repeat protein
MASWVATDAALRGDAAVLRAEILGADGHELIAAGRQGLTTLHFAARGGSEECVRLLLEAGAEKGARAENGLMPWHWATSAAVARLLLLKGADARASACVAAGVGDGAARRANVTSAASLRCTSQRLVARQSA